MTWKFKSLYQVAIVTKDGDKIREHAIFIRAEDDAAVHAYVARYYPEAIRHYIQQEVGK